MNKNPLLLPISIIIAGIIIAGAILYKPGAPNTQPAAANQRIQTAAIDYVQLAGTLGMDMKIFKTCVDKHAYKNEIAKDQTDGNAGGVQGTPATFINGIKIDGAQPFASYRSAIESELSVPPGAKRLPLPPGTPIDTDDDAVLGSLTAPVTMVIFGDYECPFCEQAYRTAEKQVRDQYVASGKVRIVFRDFPLTNIHSAALPAAEASECAHAQGKFWEYHDALFENQDRLPIP